MPFHTFQVARQVLKKWFLLTISGWLDPFSKSLSLSQEKLRNLFASVQATFALCIKGETINVIFWLLWFWICNSYELGLLSISSSLLPITQGQSTNVSFTSSRPQLLFFILPKASCCYLQSPLGDTCQCNAPNGQKPPNQVKQCLWVSFKGILSKLWRIRPSSKPHKCLSDSSLLSASNSSPHRVSFFSQTHLLVSFCLVSQGRWQPRILRSTCFSLALVKFLWKSPSSLMRVKKNNFLSKICLCKEHIVSLWSSQPRLSKKGGPWVPRARATKFADFKKEKHSQRAHHCPDWCSREGAVQWWPLKIANCKQCWGRGGTCSIKATKGTEP